jgi:hypothetical protein
MCVYTIRGSWYPSFSGQAQRRFIHYTVSTEVRFIYCTSLIDRSIFCNQFSFNARCIYQSTSVSQRRKSNRARQMRKRNTRTSHMNYVESTMGRRVTVDDTRLRHMVCEEAKKPYNTKTRASTQENKSHVIKRVTHTQTQSIKIYQWRMISDRAAAICNKSDM